MSKHYKHLSEEERDRLAILKGQDLPIRAIAAQLGRSPSTISRELRRNASSGRSSGYLPHKAQTEAELRWRQSHRRLRLKALSLPKTPSALPSLNLQRLACSNGKLTTQKVMLVPWHQLRESCRPDKSAPL